MSERTTTIDRRTRAAYERLEVAAARWREAYYANTKAHQGTIQQNAALSDILDALDALSPIQKGISKDE